LHSPSRIDTHLRRTNSSTKVVSSRNRLRHHQPPQLDPFSIHLSKLVLRLLCQPALRADPKTLERRTAISGEIPRLPFTNSDSVVRVTPSAAAASVIVKPKSAMH
jgi:hypothetical protein